jgi:hypothetical protein
MTRFFYERREIGFREAVKLYQERVAARMPDLPNEEKESYVFLVKSAQDGDWGAQSMLYDEGIICTGYDGTSIWTPDDWEPFWFQRAQP